MQQIFPMAAPKPAAKIVIAAIFLFVAAGSVFSIVVSPGGFRGMLLLTIIPTFAIAYVVVGRTGKVTFEVGDGVLYIRGDFLRHKIPIKDLRLAEARRFVRRDELGLEPRARMSRTMLPGYEGGWFQMSNQGKGIVYATDWTKAIYLPTNLGYPILLTPDDPQGFMDALRAAH